MTQSLILIFAILVPVVIAILILRAWKKYDNKEYEYPEQQYAEENKNNKKSNN
jgi:mannitol-specific phosphotransferase system IIBC component